MRPRRYPVASREPKKAPTPIERGLSDAALEEEIKRAACGEGSADPDFREEWLGRLRAEQERREEQA